MESPTHSQEPIDPSAPFRGIVVCCTSIPPEQRTDIAQRTSDLGGIHTYDLTPDVTHLIVGDYDTPKYRHVARERPDIKVMDAAWIEAVTSLWIHDEEVPFAELESQYQLKAFETRGVDADEAATDSGISCPGGVTGARGSLLICLTGFGEQRDDIATQITANGGRHTGDLTRRCTHLIVNKPEGKKFRAATTWGVRAVTLAWLELSIQRGMILDESKFDPLLPAEQQGRGAWIARDAEALSLGKRSRSAISAPGEEGARKLRKTASMKLNSQRNHLWGDILGHGTTSRENSFKQGAAQLEEQKSAPHTAQIAQESHGIFFNCVFILHGFNSERTEILSLTILGLDGKISKTLDKKSATGDDNPRRFLVVPQTSQPSTHPIIPREDCEVITEFYIEQCMHRKAFHEPADSVLGRPFPLFPIHGFDELKICTAAFTGLELNQVARTVKQLGATFEEEFRSTVSVLVCKSLQATRKDKLLYAREWNVPVVSQDWLWECVSTGFNVPVGEFLLTNSTNSDISPGGKVSVKKPKDGLVRSKSDATTRRPPPGAGVDATAFDRDSPDKKTKPVATKQLPKNGLDMISTADFVTTKPQTTSRESEAALSERSPSSLNKSPSPTKPFGTLSEKISKWTPAEPDDSATSLKPISKDTDSAFFRDDSATKTNLKALSTDAGSTVLREEQEKLAIKAAEREQLTSRITTLLDTGPDPEAMNLQPQPRPRKRQLMGRATSNSSSASGVPPVPDALLERTLSSVGGTVDENDEEKQQPPATQLEYHDPVAQERRAALMSKMMGHTAAEAVTTRASTRSSRRKS